MMEDSSKPDIKVDHLEAPPEGDVEMASPSKDQAPNQAESAPSDKLFKDLKDCDFGPPNPMAEDITGSEATEDCPDASYLIVATVGDDVIDKSDITSDFLGRTGDVIGRPSAIRGCVWVKMAVNERPATVLLWNLNDERHPKEMKTKLYQEIDVILACFSRDDPTTLKKLQEFLIPEVRETQRDIPFILVGLSRSESGFAVGRSLPKSRPVSTTTLPSNFSYSAPTTGSKVAETVREEDALEAAKSLNAPYIKIASQDDANRLLQRAILLARNKGAMAKTTSESDWKSMQSKRSNPLEVATATEV